MITKIRCWNASKFRFTNIFIHVSINRYEAVYISFITADGVQDNKLNIEEVIVK